MPLNYKTHDNYVNDVTSFASVIHFHKLPCRNVWFPVLDNVLARIRTLIPKRKKKKICNIELFVKSNIELLTNLFNNFDNFFHTTGG